MALIGFTYRRAPRVAALRDLVISGGAWSCCTSTPASGATTADPSRPISWRYKGAPGSGALADLGSRTTYLMEFLAGDITEVSGGRFTTAITERPLPLGAVVGHGQVAVSDETEPVQNDDYASFSTRFADPPTSVSSRSHGSPPVIRMGWRWRCSATRARRSGSRSGRPSSS